LIAGKSPQGYAGEAKITGAPKATARIQEEAQRAGIRENLLPDEVVVKRSTKGLQQYADDPKISDRTRGVAVYDKKGVVLRQGVPEQTAFHETGHIIDKKRAIETGGNVNLISETKEVRRALQPLRREMARYIETYKPAGYDAEFTEYVLRHRELLAEVTGEIMSGRGNLLTGLIRKAAGFRTGAYVPGIGSGDKVSALLEPGEYVLNRNAVNAIGVSQLDDLNKNKYPRFQTGGRVGRVKMQEGGQASAPMMSMPDLSQLNEIVQKFGNKVDLFAESLNNINGLEIQLVANHKVEVIINGAQVLQELQPSIQNLVVSETNTAINSMLKEKFPDVGTMD
jgi:hypothetical protein